MNKIKPLPGYLAQRFHGWKATTFDENKGWYRRLADEGQRPREMIIACCDSRVHVSSMFGSGSDELFIHRNIGALVPDYRPDGQRHATSSAIEFAVRTLRVSHLIVMGHSQCGGVRSCHAMCTGQATELESETSFVGRWLDILRPAVDQLPTDEDEARTLRLLEHKAVSLSLNNLLTFPFVCDAVESGELSLHGLWTDIGQGELEMYDAELDRFVAV